VQWKGLPATESTWEPLVSFAKQFPKFNLEDKLDLLRGSIDRLRVRRKNGEEVREVLQKGVIQKWLSLSKSLNELEALPLFQ